MSMQRTDSSSLETQSPSGSRSFWMSLEQQESPEAFTRAIPGEFAVSGSPLQEGAAALGRRDFMKVMGAGALMASMAGCTRRPVQKIVPYVTNPEEIVPGVPNYYASVDPSTGHGLIVTTREGRPIKVDGNTDHPLNKGKIDARAQASVHDLYDPDRLRAPRIAGAEVGWEQFDAELKKLLAESKGATWLLSGSVLSPTLKRVISMQGIRHVMLDSIPMDEVMDSQLQSYGARVFPRYRFEEADFILSLGADFLGNWGSSVEYTRQFAARRRLNEGEKKMCRLVVAEPALSITGQSADQRFTIHPSDLLLLACGLASEVARALGRASEEFSGLDAQSVAGKIGIAAETIQSLAKELVKHRGRGLLLAHDGGANGPALQGVVNFLNSLLGNEGKTVDGSGTSRFQGSHSEFEKLLQAIRTGGVKTLIISGLNPGYLFADSIKVKDALSKVPNLVVFSSHSDETTELAKYVAAESHAFESWGDAAATRDFYSIQQPTIRPLWATRSLLESLLAWAGGGSPSEDAYQEVLKTAKEQHARFGAGRAFQDWLDGLLMTGVAFASPGGAAPARSFRQETLRAATAAARKPANKDGEGEFTLLLTHSIALGCGAQANNALLQELPDPVSKNTWGNYLGVSPGSAKRMGWTDGDVLRVENGAGSVELPMFRQPGLRDGVVAAHLGYGRRFKGRVGNGVGVSLAGFTASSSLGTRPSHTVSGVRLVKTGKNDPVASTQTHHTLDGRHIVFETTLEEYQQNPKSGIVSEFPDGNGPASIWSGFEYKGHKWGMAIDLSSCTGCSACVVACSVENNVPAVGKDQVRKNREMQWIRIDRYYAGSPENPETLVQPMLCQHCDNAPCETVCPVIATAHSDEGLNQMIYNRCVGTKYCSNNCPYKVRRFNWFNNNGDMNGPLEHPLPLSKNPEVTLRSRGVMEKCTFCTQRIEAGKSNAKSQGRKLQDLEVRTACQVACPSDAIVFGDTNDPNSRVSRMRKDPRGFYSLEEVNARPQVTYLSKVRNRVPEKSAHGDGHGAGHGEH